MVKSKCPLCGDTGNLQKIEITDDDTVFYEVHHYIECSSIGTCGLQGPRALTENAAVTAWNVQATLFHETDASAN